MGNYFQTAFQLQAFMKYFYNTNSVKPIKIWTSSAPYYPDLSETHLKPRQTSKMDRFTIFAKRLILNVSWSSEYVSVY